jgi:hypothetical protein
MRTSQWILAVVILAGMVFAITFGMNYIGGGRDRTPSVQPREGLRLTFPTPRYPPVGLPRICEFNVPGSCDFWFYNPNDKEVKVGLELKSCKCSDVYLHLVPPEVLATYRPAVAGLGAGLSADGSLLAMAPTMVALAAAESDWATDQLVRRGQGTELKDKSDTYAVVPPHALGAIHLTWKTERAEARSLELKLWTDSKANSIPTLLDAQTVIFPALQVMPDVDFGTVQDSTLHSTTPPSKDIYCFSQTRPTLAFKAEVVHEGRPPEKDPFVVGTPVALSPAERLTLATELKIPPTMQCAYRVPVTLQPVSADGTVPFELGIFHRFVEFRCDGAGMEPQQTTVSGQVQGLVTVGGSTDGGKIAFGPFLASQGAKKTIELHTDEKLDLEVDASRVPPFLGPVELKATDVSVGGHRSWLLKVTIPEDKVVGIFPDPRVPNLRDSAIYINTRDRDGKLRAIRIPVTGTANAG